MKEKLTARKLLIKQRVDLINNLKSTFMKRGTSLPFEDLTTLKAGKWFCARGCGKIKNFSRTSLVQ
ncbi:MAG: hypothetical protein PHC64_02210 [Candidatus Gastranaerophilales bacterium]|nr:hypothetical protein [Candidatus Gastranaerophilales bacterium]